MIVYNIEYYAYLPKILIYSFLHFDLRSDPDTDPHFFPAGSGSVKKNVGSSSLDSNAIFFPDHNIYFITLPYWTLEDIVRQKFCLFLYGENTMKICFSL